jgi:hypothetical protein
MQRKVLEIERDQTADLARVDNAIALAEVRISALKKRQLGPEELSRKTSDIRDGTILAVRDVRRNMANPYISHYLCIIWHFCATVCLFFLGAEARGIKRRERRWDFMRASGERRS